MNVAARSWSCFAVALMGVAVLVQAQRSDPAPPRDPVPVGLGEREGAVVRGRVTRRDTGLPLRRVEIAAFPSQFGSFSEVVSAITGDDGRYEIGGLAEGRYNLKAVRTGFVEGWYGQRHPLEPRGALDVGDGRTYDAIDITLMSAATIAGIVVDQYGGPAVGAAIDAYRIRYVDGLPTVRRMAASANPTNDLGEFRVSGLPPGEYVLSARPDFSAASATWADLGFLPTFYPGTAALTEAQPVTVGEGEEQFVTFAIVPARTSIIEGIVVDSTGRPARGVSIDYVLSSVAGVTGGPGFESPDGRFRFGNLSPGDYMLQAVSRLPTGQERAILHVRLTGDNLTGLVLPLVKDVAVRGRIVFDSAGERRPSPSTLRVEGRAPDAQRLISLNAIPAGDWTFDSSVPPGLRWRFRVTTPPGWEARSIRIGDREIIDTAVELNVDTDVELVLTDRVSSISGAITDASGRVSGLANVLAISTDPTAWVPYTRFVRRTRADAGGHYSIEGLPGGTYVVVALEYLEEGEEGNPRLLEGVVPLGTTITVQERDAQRLNLVLSGLP